VQRRNNLRIPPLASSYCVHPRDTIHDTAPICQALSFRHEQLLQAYGSTLGGTEIPLFDGT